MTGLPIADEGGRAVKSRALHRHRKPGLRSYRRQKFTLCERLSCMVGVLMGVTEPGRL